MHQCLQVIFFRKVASYQGLVVSTSHVSIGSAQLMLKDKSLGEILTMTLADLHENFHWMPEKVMKVGMIPYCVKSVISPACN